MLENPAKTQSLNMTERVKFLLLLNNHVSLVLDRTKMTIHSSIELESLLT